MGLECPASETVKGFTRAGAIFNEPKANGLSATPVGDRLLLPALPKVRLLDEAEINLTAKVHTCAPGKILCHFLMRKFPIARQSIPEQ
jgi:hypothetical protein